MTVVTLYSQTVAEFIRVTGRGQAVSTVNIASRFGWDSREAYGRLLELERAGEIVRTGSDRIDIGKAQFWGVPAGVSG